MQYKPDKPDHGTIGNVKYQCSIEWRKGKFISNEPITAGGKDMGPKQCPISKILEGEIKVRTFLFKVSETEKEINYLNDEITVVGSRSAANTQQDAGKNYPKYLITKKALDQSP